MSLPREKVCLLQWFWMLHARCILVLHRCCKSCSTFTSSTCCATYFNTPRHTDEEGIRAGSGHGRNLKINTLKTTVTEDVTMEECVSRGPIGSSFPVDESTNRRRRHYARLEASVVPRSIESRWRNLKQWRQIWLQWILGRWKKELKLIRAKWRNRL